MQHNNVFNRNLLAKLIIEAGNGTATRATNSRGTYITTVYSTEDIKSVRRVVRMANKMIKRAGVSSGYKIDIKGRLGKKNPNAHKYVTRDKWGKGIDQWDGRIRIEDATRFDVYVYFKSRQESLDWLKN